MTKLQIVDVRWSKHSRPFDNAHGRWKRKGPVWVTNRAKPSSSHGIYFGRGGFSAYVLWAGWVRGR